jgi:hypothetical protein
MLSAIGRGVRYLWALVRRAVIAFAAPDPPSAVYMDEMTKYYDERPTS